MKHLLCFLILLVNFNVQAEEITQPAVNNYELVSTENGELYLLADNRVWQIDKQQLKPVTNAQQARLLSTKQLPSTQSAVQSMWQNLTGLGYVVLLLMFGFLYLYYQSSLNRRRKAFYERIKVQQQVLSIAFLATGDEVLECNIRDKEVTRINQNTKLNIGDQVYFQSEKFISKLHKDDSSFFISHFESLLSGGKNNYDITYRISDGNDGWIWIAERGCVIERDASGIATRLVASMRDISEIKHDQELLLRVVNELEVRLKRAEVAATMRN